jgi:hypothetical protein
MVAFNTPGSQPSNSKNHTIRGAAFANFLIENEERHRYQPPSLKGYLPEHKQRQDRIQTLYTQMHELLASRLQASAERFAQQGLTSQELDTILAAVTQQIVAQPKDEVERYAVKTFKSTAKESHFILAISDKSAEIEGYTQAVVSVQIDMARQSGNAKNVLGFNILMHADAERQRRRPPTKVTQVERSIVLRQLGAFKTGVRFELARQLGQSIDSHQVANRVDAQSITVLKAIAENYGFDPSLTDMLSKWQGRGAGSG